MVMDGKMLLQQEDVIQRIITILYREIMFLMLVLKLLLYQVELKNIGSLQARIHQMLKKLEYGFLIHLKLFIRNIIEDSLMVNTIKISLILIYISQMLYLMQTILSKQNLQFRDLLHIEAT